MREITLAPSQGINGGPAEANDPVRVYDCSGPWGDPEFHGDINQGLPRPREAWIRARSDVEEYEGRAVAPMDNGYLSGKHAEYASQSEKNRLIEFPGRREKPLRAANGHPVTQMWYARRGIITPEME
jgi:phosphomethylpyrimidine synthase